MRTNLEALEHARWRPPDHITIQYTLHNHPSGDATPSDTDRRLTRAASLAATTMQIQLLDHLIMGASADGCAGYFSFKEAGLL
jgi:DNA repair protein RadC